MQKNGCHKQGSAYHNKDITIRDKITAYVTKRDIHIYIHFLCHDKYARVGTLGELPAI